MAIAIIPARGGSKRIPHKNIRPFHGRAMIGWPISVAQESGLFSRIIVSTDDPVIAQIARDEGAETPFVRAPELSDDHTGTTEVIVDAIKQLELAEAEDVCCIYATAPFVTPGDLGDGQAKLAQAPESYVFSVCEFPAPIARAYQIGSNGLRPVSPSDMPKRSQDLAAAYFDAGQFYWAKAATWLSGKKVWDQAQPVILPASRVCDIDTEDDWKRAEQMFALQSRP